MAKNCFIVFFAPVLLLGLSQTNQCSAERPEARTFHKLLDHHDEIKRTYQNTTSGVESSTWSSNEKVSRWIKQHVKEMKALAESEYGAIRQWDDLFIAMFDLRNEHNMEITETKNGVDIVKTGSSPCSVALVQAHAEVVSQFVKKGYEEAHSNHEVPKTCK
eukprot:857914_1